MIDKSVAMATVVKFSK